jgi:hypothetical protein
MSRLNDILRIRKPGQRYPEGFSWCWDSNTKALYWKKGRTIRALKWDIARQKFTAAKAVIDMSWTKKTSH